VSLSDEIAAFRRALRKIDPKTAVVLTTTALLVILQMKFGSRGFFRSEVAPALGVPGNGLMAWGWWFGLQGLLGFLVPVTILRLAFRSSRSEMGLGLGDWRFAIRIAALYVPLVAAGTWILSDSAAFQADYPHLQSATESWSVFLAYEALFLFYWIGWEYLWRGFIIFGTRHSLGLYAIFVQAMPFAILHYSKPFPEAILSIAGGIALGALVWRSRAFWIAVPIHWLQMMLLDLFCTMRIRSGASGWGLGALIDLFK